MEDRVWGRVEWVYGVRQPLCLEEGLVVEVEEMQMEGTAYHGARGINVNSAAVGVTESK